ncbi:MAG TPA: efflux RND transporter permease subunit [Terriglobia bacterium]|nr:efflux RND transporter permease subunit [Terriglobia bacterium]
MSDAQRPPSERPKRAAGFNGIARWSIDHPYIIAAFYAGMLALAWIAMTRAIPRRFAPYVESPVIGVISMMPGLSAEEMELYVSKPIEEQLVNIKGLRYIRSTSQDGFSIVALEFPYGHDMKAAIFDVQALMNVVQSNLPATGANLKPSWVVPIDALNLPVLSLSVRGDPGQGWDPVKVREFADNTVINRFKTVPNVYSVVPFGGYRRQLQVDVDRNKLASYGISILDVRDAIDRFNVSRPAGNLTSGASESIVRVDTRAASAADVRNYPVAAFGPGSNGLRQTPGVSAGGSGGSGMGAMGGAPSAPGPGGTTAPASGFSRPVYVRDVATVTDGYWERRSGYHYLRHDSGTAGEVAPAIEVSVIQDPGASSAQVVPAVMKVARALEAENPGIAFEVAYDNAHFVNVLFRNIWEELLVAIVLTGLAVFLFLGEWRGTLIAMITLPTSLAMAVLLMTPFGMTFNSGTLIGLLLSIGRLVDDSVIDIHAVERHLRLGKSARIATIDGISEVRLAVVASTVMMALALAPLLFSGGITQQMFRELVWPFVFGLLSSMIVSFTLTALLSANLLRHEEARARDRQHWLLGPLYRILDPFQRLLDRLERGYGRLIRWMLQHRFSNLARIAATVLIGFTFYHFIGSEMMPLADVGQASGLLEMQPGSSYQATEAAVGDLERIMLKYPELEKASIEIGAESMFESWSPYFTGYQMPQASAASMMLTFSDKDERGRSIWQIMDAIQKEAMATIPGIRRLQLKEMGSDVMATAAAPIHMLIHGPDLGTLDRLGRDVNHVAEKLPDMVQPGTTWTMGLPNYRIKVNPARAQELNLSPESISQQAYYALRGGLTSEFLRIPNVRQNTILVRYRPEDRSGPDDLESLHITTPDGRQVPLKSVATVEKTFSPTAIEHDGLRRVIGVTGYYRHGFLPSMDVAMELVAKAYGGDPALGIEAANFPPGYGMEMRGDLTQMMDSFRRLLSGLGLAIILMYLVLVMQFRGFLQPFQMIASLPLELAGVFTALWLAHQSFSTVSMLGVIVLTGMDITTAVLMIDMIMKYRAAGMPRDEAVARACPERLRPILMTSMISLIVLLPVAIAPRTGLDAYQPLATTVVGGLLIGTILSLFDIPIMHTVLDDFVRWLNRTFFGRDTRGAVHAIEDANVEQSIGAAPLDPRS